VFQTIRAEYGEGFETFRPDGPLKVDVVRILTRLICVLQLFSHIFVEFGYHVMLVEAGMRVAHCKKVFLIKRIRYAMKLDGAYGLGLFDFVNHIHLFKEPTGELSWCGYVKRFKIQLNSFSFLTIHGW
jgi:hypothetical protein